VGCRGGKWDCNIFMGFMVNIGLELGGIIIRFKCGGSYARVRLIGMFNCGRHMGRSNIRFKCGMGYSRVCDLGLCVGGVFS